MKTDYLEKLDDIKQESIEKMSQLADLIVNETLEMKIDVQGAGFGENTIKELLIKIKKYQNEESYNNIIPTGEYQLIRKKLSDNGIIVYAKEELAFCRSSKISKLIGFKDWADVIKLHKDYLKTSKNVSVLGKTFRIIIIEGKLDIDNRF